MLVIVAQISPKSQKPFSPCLLGAFSLRKPQPIYLKITSLHNLNLLVFQLQNNFLLCTIDLANCEKFGRGMSGLDGLSTEWPRRKNHSWLDKMRTLLIDNKEVVNRGNSTPIFLNVRTYLLLDYDLWLLMVELQNLLQVNVMFEWIKSHQSSLDSDNMSNDNVRILGQKIQLNEDVDGLASQTYLSEHFPTEQSAFFCRQSLLQSKWGTYPGYC
jgi:hypothetical protein